MFSRLNLRRLCSHSLPVREIVAKSGFPAAILQFFPAFAARMGVSAAICPVNRA